MTRICSVEGCAALHCARGWCKNHYYAWKRNGDPLLQRRLPRGAGIEEALSVYVDRSNGPDGCWPWTAARKHPSLRWGDYGISGVDGRSRLAHRMAWEVAFGAIPDGLFVCHRCDNPPCCNPAHLFLGTAADNVQDMVAKGRDARPLATEHPNARLTHQAIHEIRDLRLQGWTYQQLASRFAISKTSCHNVLTGKTYASVMTR